MKKFKPNIPLGIGLIMFSCTQIADHLVTMPDILFRVLMISALILEFWGIFVYARSDAMKNSKLRQWKMRLIGKK